jgi:hypothetical protein
MYLNFLYLEVKKDCFVASLPAMTVLLILVLAPDTNQPYFNCHYESAQREKQSLQSRKVHAMA